MADPLVTKVIGPDGVERWGAVDAPWIQDAAPAAPGPDTPPVTKVDAGGEEVSDAAEVPADGPDPNTRTGKRRS